MILRDFQICAAPNAHDYAINAATFPIYEAVRLDLKRRRPTAPFNKIVIGLRDPSAFSRTFVVVALGICEAFVPLDLKHLAAVLPAVPEILDAIETDVRARPGPRATSSARLVKHACGRTSCPM
jgi:hypothetical protein